jgi:8-oxo-dGTP pyrophosphatase MutT (NUDIX family)
VTASGRIIRIAAAVIHDEAGRLLLVRKRGTQAFMQAGGKIEPGEAPAAALARELQEELGLEIGAEDPRYLGCYWAPAANEPDHLVEAELFALDAVGSVSPGAEIEEIAWLHPADIDQLPLAPLTRDHVMAMRAGDGGAAAGMGAEVR